jgi:hypothetical protein
VPGKFIVSINCNFLLFKNLNELAKASVLSTSGDEGTVSSDNQESEQLQGKQADQPANKGVKKSGSSSVADSGEPKPSRPALLAMKLTESETSEDDVVKR